MTGLFMAFLLRLTIANKKNRVLSESFLITCGCCSSLVPAFSHFHSGVTHSTHPLLFPQDFFTEASQSRMNVLIPKLQEVNRCLNDLITCNGAVSFAEVTRLYSDSGLKLNILDYFSNVRF